MHHLGCITAYENLKNAKCACFERFSLLIHPAHSINTTHGVGRDTEPSGVLT